MATIVGLSLVGCAGVSPVPAPTQTHAASQAPSPTPTAEPAPEPTLAPELSADENLDYFDYVARGVLKTDSAPGGQAFIDALIAGGFDKKTMEVTFDRTQADLAADSIQFSVRVNGDCLIGQTGPASGGYHSMVADVLSSGTCLVGGTRQIDW